MNENSIEQLKDEIADAIYKGEPIALDLARRTGKITLIRKILQEIAGKYIDDGDHVRAVIALREAEKLNPLG